MGATALLHAGVSNSSSPASWMKGTGPVHGLDRAHGPPACMPGLAHTAPGMGCWPQQVPWAAQPRTWPQWAPRIVCVPGAVWGSRWSNRAVLGGWIMGLHRLDLVCELQIWPSAFSFNKPIGKKCSFAHFMSTDTIFMHRSEDETFGALLQRYDALQSHPSWESGGISPSSYGSRKAGILAILGALFSFSFLILLIKDHLYWFWGEKTHKTTPPPLLFRTDEKRLGNF